MAAGASERPKPVPSKAGAARDPRALQDIGLREARAQLESFVQHVIDVQRRRRALARKGR